MCARDEDIERWGYCDLCCEDEDLCYLCGVEIERREWVFWGYDQDRKPHTFAHMERAVTTVDADVCKFSYKFKLPEHRPESTIGPPVEYERRTCWGWRVRWAAARCSTEWRACETACEARRQAEEWFKRGKKGIDRSRRIRKEEQENARQ